MKLPQRFIVVDDDRTNNMICEFSLARFSAVTDIKTFLEPQAALQFIRDSYEDVQDNIPTVLFLDINMPVLTGWDFLEIFNDFSDEVKRQFNIYILTSSIDGRDKEKAETNPLIIDVIEKPLNKASIHKLFG